MLICGIPTLWHRFSTVSYLMATTCGQTPTSPSAQRFFERLANSREFLLGGRAQVNGP
jgi:hypothetical protein